MNPRFAEAVDPLFLHVFSLLERIDNQQAMSASDEQGPIERLLQRADDVLEGQEGTWKHAKYALVAWIDEMLGSAHDWPGQQEWQGRALEDKVFGSFNANELYYLNAKEAVEQSDADAVETYYVCVLLGFQGLYRVSPENRALIHEHQLPSDVVDWSKRFSDFVRGFRQRSTPAKEPAKRRQPIVTAKPSWKQSWIVWLWGLSVVLAGLNVLCFLWT